MTTPELNALTTAVNAVNLEFMAGVLADAELPQAPTQTAEFIALVGELKRRGIVQSLAKAASTRTAPYTGNPETAAGSNGPTRAYCPEESTPLPGSPNNAA